MTREQRADRDARLLRDRIRGATARQLAQRYDLSIRQVRRICNRHQASASEPEVEDEVLRVIRSAASQEDEVLAGLLAGLRPPGHPGVALAIIRQENRLTRAKLELLRLTNYLR